MCIRDRHCIVCIYLGKTNLSLRVYNHINAATVICRQLNFNRVLFATKGGVFSPGSGRIWLDKVRCNGLESNIAECQHPGWGVVDAACDHVHDAGVVCGCKWKISWWYRLSK